MIFERGGLYDRHAYFLRSNGVSTTEADRLGPENPFPHYILLLD
jgi:hypothetical protein